MAVETRKKRKLNVGIGNVLSATDACTILEQSPSCTKTLRRVLKKLLVGGPEAESFAEDLLASGFLCLVPSILKLSSGKGVAVAVEVLGALSMSSLTAHRRVVSDKNAMCALAEILTRADLELLTVACHASMDLLITPLGCESLRDSGVINYLLRLLCWIGDLSQEDQKRFVNNGHSSTPWAAGNTDLDCHEVGKSFRLLLPSKLCSDIESTYGDRKEVTNIAVQEAVFLEELQELITTASTAMSALIRYVGVESFSEDLSRGVLKFLRCFWHSLLSEDQVLLKSTECDEKPEWTCNRGTRKLIAKCVVQLAMEFGSNCRNLSIQQGLFEKTDFDQKLFFENFWEQTPVVLSKVLPSCLSPLSQKFATLPQVVNNFLAWTVGCPRAVADQLDSLCLLESIESGLGEPMIYGQDIRIVKTVPLELDATSQTQPPERTVEIHYNQQGATSNGQVPNYVHPREVIEAVKNGYSVAIKGMELRCSSIAEVADCLARQCRQPSVGVNLYITPPNAQGLGLHYDDHCVFVCQLVGCKTWNIFPPQKLIPRLYAPRTLSLEVLDRPTVYRLGRGDVLYIPRGFPHMARCEQQEGVACDVLCFQKTEGNTAEENCGSVRSGADEDSSFSDNLLPGMYSLHLTFGVEVEPPFQWEGLLHIALRLWTKEMAQLQGSSRQNDPDTYKESQNRYENLCEGLLHIAINLVGEKEVMLRKACMIAAEHSSPQPSLSGLREEVVASHKFVCEQGKSLVCDVCDPASLEYFQGLLEVVSREANFKEAYAFAEGLTGEGIGSFTGGMEWLRHIPDPGGCSLTSPSEPVALGLSNIKSKLYDANVMSEIEVGFISMKVDFCKALFFHQASEAFRSVHRKYRTVRKKFVEGMLALHDKF